AELQQCLGKDPVCDREPAAVAEIFEASLCVPPEAERLAGVPLGQRDATQVGGGHGSPSLVPPHPKKRQGLRKTGLRAVSVSGFQKDKAEGVEGDRLVAPIPQIAKER